MSFCQLTPPYLTQLSVKLAFANPGCSVKSSPGFSLSPRLQQRLNLKFPEVEPLSPSPSPSLFGPARVWFRFPGITRVIITYWGPLARSFYLSPLIYLSAPRYCPHSRILPKRTAGLPRRFCSSELRKTATAPLAPGGDLFKGRPPPRRLQF